MKTISLVASKGGVGKSCLTAALCVAAAQANEGARVGILDADPQGSLTAWWNWRALPWPRLYSANGLPLAATAAALRDDGLDYLFIDTAPGLTAWQREAIEVSDVTLVPCQASRIDLAAIETTEAILGAIGATSALVLNRAGFHTRLAGQAVTAVRDTGRILLPVQHQRVDVPEAMALGRTAAETRPRGAAAREQRALWRAVDDLLAASPPAMVGHWEIAA